MKNHHHLTDQEIRLSFYTAEENPRAALLKLQAEATRNPHTIADEIVNVWEPLQFKYTVKELLELSK